MCLSLSHTHAPSSRFHDTHARTRALFLTLVARSSRREAEQTGAVRVRESESSSRSLPASAASGCVLIKREVYREPAGFSPIYLSRSSLSHSYLFSPRGAAPILQTQLESSVDCAQCRRHTHTHSVDHGR